MSTGFLPNAHEESCPIYKKIIKAKPCMEQKPLIKIAVIGP
jgi:hypothetical protein